MINRRITKELRAISGKYPVISVTGPRQSGKTTLIKSIFPEYLYANLEFPDVREYASLDPRSFLAQSENMIIDEVQRVPDLLSYIQGFVDENNKRRYIISGSQNLLIFEKISQSLAGRVFTANLFPLSLGELKDASLSETDLVSQLYKGFYPRIYNENLDSSIWYDNYIQTYLERDVRNIKSVENLSTFQKFIGLLAGRTGQILNLTSLASDTGISVPTVKSWISILEASFIIKLLQPYHTNWNKRIIKSPKLHFLDTGLVCALLKINNASELARHPLIGSIFETYVFSEFVKKKANFEIHADMYYWRDKVGKEVDIILESGTHVDAIEVKYGQTIMSDFFANLNKYKSLSKVDTNLVVVFGGKETQKRSDHAIVAWTDI